MIRFLGRRMAKKEFGRLPVEPMSPDVRPAQEAADESNDIKPDNTLRINNQ